MTHPWSPARAAGQTYVLLLSPGPAYLAPPPGHLEERRAEYARWADSLARARQARLGRPSRASGRRRRRLVHHPRGERLRRRADRRDVPPHQVQRAHRGSAVHRVSRAYAARRVVARRISDQWCSYVRRGYGRSVRPLTHGNVELDHRRWIPGHKKVRVVRTIRRCEEARTSRGPDYGHPDRSGTLPWTSCRPWNPTQEDPALSWRRRS